MHIRPELTALRSDDAPQRRAQARLIAVVDDWRATPPVAAAAAELGSFAKGIPLDDLPLLSALFTAGDPSAQQFTSSLVALLVAELRDDPLGQVPLRHFSDGMLASLVLARQGGAALVLQAIDGAALAKKPEPLAVSFAATETWEHVLAGSATVERVRVAEVLSGRAVLRRESVELAAGLVARRFCASEAQILRRVPGILVALKLQRALDPSEPTREYRLADGALIHQAAGSPRESRLELTAALLGGWGAAMPRRCWPRWRRSRAGPACAGRRCANVWGWTVRWGSPRCAPSPSAVVIRWPFRRARWPHNCWNNTPSWPELTDAPRD